MKVKFVKTSDLLTMNEFLQDKDVSGIEMVTKTITAIYYEECDCKKKNKVS